MRTMNQESRQQDFEGLPAVTRSSEMMQQREAVRDGDGKPGDAAAIDAYSRNLSPFYRSTPEHVLK